MSPRAATLIGFSAVLMWAALAFLSKAAGAIPPFELTALTFLLGGFLGAASWLFRPGVPASLHSVKPAVWLLGIASLFSYHLLYFTAIQHAPAVEVSLIAYLWPLLLVVFSAFLPGERLRWHHVAGVALGLAGAVIVMTGGNGLSFSQGLKPGHFIALPCAVIWAFYSVLSRRFGKVPTDVVAVFCLTTALLSFLCHLLWEDWVQPSSSTQWLAIIALGCLPLGGGFYAWDYGLKHGDVMTLAAASYAAPLLSTVLLIVTGYATFHWPILAACLLITFGGLVAAKDLLLPGKSHHDLIRSDNQIK